MGEADVLRGGLHVLARAGSEAEAAGHEDREPEHEEEEPVGEATAQHAPRDPDVVLDHAEADLDGRVIRSHRLELAVALFGPVARPHGAGAQPLTGRGRGGWRVLPLGRWWRLCHREGRQRTAGAPKQ